MNRATLLLGLALATGSFAGCGAESRDVTVHAIEVGGACDAYLQLQCECCGSGTTYCKQYVADLVASGEAVSTSTEAECAARKTEVTSVTAWCLSTFRTEDTLRTACQGFPPGTPGPSSRLDAVSAGDSAASDVSATDGAVSETRTSGD